MAAPDDGSWVAILLGGGSVLGVAVSKGFDYLKVRRRESIGDRRATNKEWGGLIAEFRKSIGEAKSEAQDAKRKSEAAESRIADCESHRADCEARLSIHEKAIKELGMTIGMRLLEPENGP